MSTIYVDNNGSNTPPYDTWAKAATTLNTALAEYSSGDIILVNKTHSEGTATVTLGAAGSLTEPVPIYTADSADDSYAVATANTFDLSDSGADLNGNAGGFYAFHGLTFSVNDNISFSLTGGYNSFIDCTFSNNSPGAVLTFGEGLGRNYAFIKDCRFSTPIGTSNIILNGLVVLNGCVFNNSVNGQLFTTTASRPASHIIRGCDFSGATFSGAYLVDISGVTSNHARLQFINCEFPGSIAISNTINSDGASVELISCDDAGALYRYEYYGYRATITTQTGDLYRTSGYSDADGNTNASHKIVPTTHMHRATRIEGPMLTQYIDTTGSKTLTVHAADTFTAAPNKNQLYIEVFHLDAAGETLWSYGTSRDANILATTALTPTTGEWTDSGAALNNEYKMEKTINIARAGYIGVRVVLEGDQTAETANALYYDPKIEIS